MPPDPEYGHIPQLQRGASGLRLSGAEGTGGLRTRILRETVFPCASGFCTQLRPRHYGRSASRLLQDGRSGDRKMHPVQFQTLFPAKKVKLARQRR